jgi:hypothetical protein
MGLTAEHFKKGGKTIANYTAALLNAAKKNYNIPEVLKTGLLTPLLKNYTYKPPRFFALA